MSVIAGLPLISVQFMDRRGLKMAKKEEKVEKVEKVDKKAILLGELEGLKTLNTTKAKDLVVEILKLI